MEPAPEIAPRAAPRPRQPRRAPLGERKRADRRSGRRRVLASVRRHLSQEQRALDPLLRSRRSPAARFGRALVMLIASAIVHGSVVALGLWGGAGKRGRGDINQQVKIEVREKKVETLPEPKPAEPPKEIEKPVRVPTRVVKAAPPPLAPPPPADAPKGPPPRVVGISLEATVEGGGGAAFAVGNTRAGETAARAATPQEVPPVAPEAPKAVEAPVRNQVAARIPTSGVKYALPRRKRPSTPPYPETLKTQGIEADVTVMVSLDNAGKVTDVKVIKPALYPEFNEAARAAAAAEEFEPATRDDVPIPYTLSFTYRFRLQEE